MQEQELKGKEMFENLRKNTDKCALCKEKSLFNGCSVLLVAVTESGDVISPFQNKDEATSVMIPLCAYHMVISQEGLIAMTTDNRIIQAKTLEPLEIQTDKDLKKLVKRLSRAERNKTNMLWKSTAKAIISGREFQRSMNQEKKNGIRKE